MQVFPGQPAGRRAPQAIMGASVRGYAALCCAVGATGSVTAWPPRSLYFSFSHSLNLATCCSSYWLTRPMHAFRRRISRSSVSSTYDTCE